MLNKKGKLNPADIRQRIFRYCAYQERCHSEVKNKLYELGASRADIDEIISDLITGGFLNEERFARAFAGGKFRVKSWGRIKITHALEAKGLTATCIRSGMQEIGEPEYQETLLELIQKKLEQTAEENPYIKREKIANYVIQKGFEPDLVWKILREKNV